MLAVLAVIAIGAATVAVDQRQTVVGQRDRATSAQVAGLAQSLRRNQPDLVRGCSGIGVPARRRPVVIQLISWRSSVTWRKLRAATAAEGREQGPRPDPLLRRTRRRHPQDLENLDQAALRPQPTAMVQAILVLHRVGDPTYQDENAKMRALSRADRPQ